RGAAASGGDRGRLPAGRLGALVPRAPLPLRPRDRQPPAECRALRRLPRSHPAAGSEDLRHRGAHLPAARAARGAPAARQGAPGDARGSGAVPRVPIVASVEDAAGCLSRSRLHVNPMRYGAGLKQKFLDSLAAGLPFVTTTVGAEGFPLVALRESLVADDPAGLARAIARLYT